MKTRTARSLRRETKGVYIYKNTPMVTYSATILSKKKKKNEFKKKTNRKKLEVHIVFGILRAKIAR